MDKFIFDKSQFEKILSQNLGKSVGYSGKENSNIGVLRREKGIFRKAKYYVEDEPVLLDSIHFIDLKEGEMGFGLHYDFMIFSRRKPNLSEDIYFVHKN